MSAGNVDNVDYARAIAVDIELVFDQSVATGIVFVGNGPFDALVIVIVELDSVKRNVLVVFVNALVRCAFVVHVEQRPKEGRDEEITCRNSLSRAARQMIMAAPRR